MIRKDKLKCTNCGEDKAPNKGFYLSHSKQYVENDGRMTICKECLFKLYDIYLDKYKSEIKAMYHLCMNYDVYFNKDLFDSAYSQNNRSNDRYSVLKVYMQKVNSLKQYKGMSSIDSDHIILSDVYIIDEKDTVEEIETKKDKKINDKIRKRWGSEYTDEDCMLLEDYYEDYFNNMNHDNDYGKLEILKEVCGFKLIIAQAKKDRDHKTIKDFTELISKRMADGELKPSQQKKIGEGDEDMYSLKMKIIERKRPIRKCLKEYEDVDGFWKYINKHMIKPFAMALGLAKGEYDIENGSENIILEDKINSELEKSNEN